MTSLRFENKENGGTIYSFGTCNKNRPELFRDSLRIHKTRIAELKELLYSIEEEKCYEKV